MSNVQILEKPLQLSPGAICWLRKGAARLLIQIVADIAGSVTYTYPLKPKDKEQYQADKKDVFVDLKDLEYNNQLCLNKTPNVTVNKYFKQNSKD